MGACTCVCRDPAHVGAMLFVCMLPVSPSLAICVFYSAQQKGWLCCKSSCHGCPALHRRAGPLAPRDNHSLAEGHFFFPPLACWRGPGGWRRGTA